MNTDTKRHIDAARQVLVGVVPNPASQIDQITYALIYKFMDDMDQVAIKNGDEPAFFTGELEQYSWARLMDTRIGNQDRMNLYVVAFQKFAEAKQLPELFRSILKSAFLPYRSPETLGLFLKEISYFDYSHPEELGNAYEYLLSIMSSQGDAGQFRTPRHIIDFIVDVVNPTKDDKMLDPACGTGGFLVSSYRHILEQHDGKDDSQKIEKPLTPDERKKLMGNLEGYDIDPTMVRIAQVNMYLHQFKNPKIFQYDSLSSDERWNDKFDVILANPPFMSPKGGIKPHSKFSILSSRSEVLFVDYIMTHLRPKGRAGIIVPEGIIFQSGASHTQLRKNLIGDGLYAVVSLPSGVFAPYSGVKTSILFFNNELAKDSTAILFVDIKDTGVSLGATQRTIAKNDLIQARAILKDFQNNIRVEPTRLAFSVEKSEIIALDFDLSQSKYRKITATSSEKPFVSLSSVCTITKGKSSSTKTEPGIYPLYLTAEEHKTASHFDFDQEGVAVPLISATGHGKAAIKRVHYVKGKFALANLLAFLEPKDTEVLSPKYLYHVLDSAKDEMARLMKGAANVSMKTSDLESFQIPLPSLEIQEQVMAELDGYAGIIAGAKQIAQNWKPKIEIDPEWEKLELGEILSFVGSGATPLGGQEVYQSKGILFIRSQNVLWGECDFSDAVFISEKTNQEMKRSFVMKNDVLLNITGASIGRCAIYNQTERANVNQHVTILRCSERVLPQFLMNIILGKAIQDEIWSVQGGASRQALNYQQIRQFQIPLPPLPTQRTIVEKIEAERALVESAKKLIDIYDKKTKEAIAKLWEE